MKKSILTIFLSLIGIVAFAQKADTVKADTTVQVIMKMNEYRALIQVIDQNIDSKQTTKEIINFIGSRSKIVADKPKETKK